MGRSIRARAASTGRKDRALSQKHPASPTEARRMPAAAGPSTRAVLKAIELRAMALERSSRPARSIVKVCRAGRSKALITPKTTPRASTIQGRTTPALTTAASAVAWTSAAVCVAATSFRLSMWSATTPAQREKARTGRNWQKPSNPSMKAEPVSRCISHP